MLVLVMEDMMELVVHSHTELVTLLKKVVVVAVVVVITQQQQVLVMVDQVLL